MLQYLILNNHIQSAKAFNHVSNLTWKEILLSSFSKGHRQSFFTIFDLLKKQEKLQFYLRVYFLIYSIHPILNQNHKIVAIPEKQINCFRQFLDTKGADLAKTSQFLEFYALPFIKKPLEHATFKTLFTKNWVNNLKDKLVAFMQIQDQSMKQISKAFFLRGVTLLQVEKQGRPQSIISERQSPSPTFTQKQISSNPYQQKFHALQQTNTQLFNQLEQIKSLYNSLEQNHQSMIQGFNDYMMQSQNKWFESYKQLVRTARGLLGAVGSLLGQNPRLQRKYLQGKKKIEKYERFVAKKLQDLMSVSQDISVFDKPSVNQISQYTMKSGYTSKSWVSHLDRNISNNNNNITSYVQIDEYISTNFQKLNQDFMKMKNEDQLIIIEGFCWRLIKAKSKQIKRMYCTGMIMGNFLGLGKIVKKSQNQDLELCTRFLTNRNISQKILQLLSYIKSDYYCRQYLFLQNNITFYMIQLMTQALQQNDLNSFYTSLDIISTVSVYKDYQQSILQTSFPLFLLNVLESYPKIFQSDELMELILMTLMNFASCKEGLVLFEQYEDVFSLLSVVFQQENHDIMMLANGFYYTLLSNKKLYDNAIECNMVEFIKYMMTEQKYKEHERQLRFIDERLKNYCGQEKKIDDKGEMQYLIDGEQDQQQIEVTQEQLINLEEYIKGHQLLCNKYSLRQKQAEQQQRKIKQIDQDFTLKILNIKIATQNAQINILERQKNVKQKQGVKIISNNIPQQSRLKKPTQLKSQQIQVSMISLGGNQAQQSSIKQQLFNSPTPKIDLIKQTPKLIPGNTKQAQFMGNFSKQKNPTFAKQKTEPNQLFNSPSTPMMENHNLPNFGSASPPIELGPQQKTRRKQILKQLNEEIQSKKKLKAQKHSQKQKSKSTSGENNVANHNANFIKKKQAPDQQNFVTKQGRSNIHMAKESIQIKKTPIQKQQQRKVFQSRPKINRTPPKQQQNEYSSN